MPINIFVLPYFTSGIEEYSIATALSISAIYTLIALQENIQFVDGLKDVEARLLETKKTNVYDVMQMVSKMCRGWNSITSMDSRSKSVGLWST